MFHAVPRTRLGPSARIARQYIKTPGDYIVARRRPLRPSRPSRILAASGMAQLTIQNYFNLALEHHRAGRLREAEQLYRQILARQPQHADVMYNLGTLAHQVGRNDVTVDLMRRTIALRPDHAAAHYELANALRDQRRLEEAVVAYRRAIALRPDFPGAYNNLG